MDHVAVDATNAAVAFAPAALHAPVDHRAPPILATAPPSPHPSPYLHILLFSGRVFSTKAFLASDFAVYIIYLHHGDFDVGVIAAAIVPAALLLLLLPCCCCHCCPSL